MATKKKTTIAAEVETRIFIQRYRQHMREHLKEWNRLERELGRLERKDPRAAHRLSNKMDRLSIDWTDIRLSLEVIMLFAKIMDRMKSQ